MRNIVLVILFFCTIKSYGQVVELPLPIRHTNKDIPFPPKKNKDGTFDFGDLSYEREARLVLYPNQNARFEISIFAKQQKLIICDTSGHVLYSQTKRKGHYLCTTNSSYQYFVIYELMNDGMRNIISYNPIDDFNRDINFGGKKKVDALIKITAKLK
jgi:hypothetical protein